MQRTDLDTPLLTIPSSTERTSSRFVRLTCSGILIISCTIFGFTQCYAQDVAEAARQEKARKENQQKKPKHVYTDEDLQRAQILTPEDRAEVQAKKNQQPVPGVEAPPEPVDAQALPADLPLGDLARQYRRMREMLRLEQSAEFHLPFAEPALATPKPLEVGTPEAPAPGAPKRLVAPARPIIVIPAEPRIEPFQPPVKRSPFERPRIYLAGPSRSSAKRVTAPQAPAVGERPSRPSTTLTLPSKPAAPAPDLNVMPSPRLARHATPTRPAAPIVSNAPSRESVFSARPSKPTAPELDFSVMPGPRLTPHTTPSQPAAPSVRTTGSRPSGLLAMPSGPVAPAPNFAVMPSPKVATHVTPGQPAAPVLRTAPSLASDLSVTPSEPVEPAPDFSVMPSRPLVPHVVPAQPVPPVIRYAPSGQAALAVNPSEPAAPAHEAKPSGPSVTGLEPAKPILPSAPAAPAKLSVVIVKAGDSLWKLAQEKLGKGLRWREILAVNPEIVNGNRIVAGSQLNLPAVTSSERTATSVAVEKGDTLSQIALARFGHASYWSCITRANPTLRNPNMIIEGQLLALPASCKP
ncbi:MAG TPA: LysM peptidoglycan-binding domain-containing protein [Candidatus Cybelea sp.]|nr:LysM peptidoglycan-binding domain-containing protein [Candidatus Cybelea sp.]